MSAATTTFIPSVDDSSMTTTTPQPQHDRNAAATGTTSGNLHVA